MPSRLLSTSGPTRIPFVTAMNTRRPISKLRRGLCLSLTAAFWFFIAASAPHRVHHFFEQFNASAEDHSAGAQTLELADAEQHHHSSHPDRQPPQRNDCVVLAAAQSTHASVVPTFSLSVAERVFEHRDEQHVVTASFFNPAPFSQRAPPRA